MVIQVVFIERKTQEAANHLAMTHVNLSQGITLAGWTTALCHVVGAIVATVPVIFIRAIIASTTLLFQPAIPTSTTVDTKHGVFKPQPRRPCVKLQL